MGNCSLLEQTRCTFCSLHIGPQPRSLPKQFGFLGIQGGGLHHVCELKHSIPGLLKRGFGQSWNGQFETNKIPEGWPWPSMLVGGTAEAGQPPVSPSGKREGAGGGGSVRSLRVSKTLSHDGCPGSWVRACLCGCGSYKRTFKGACACTHRRGALNRMSCKQIWECFACR